MEDAELYQKSNSLQRRDAIQCLETYARKIKWRKSDRVIDIGCGDGGVSDILKTYMPVNSNLLGCDISEKMIDFANINHGDERTEFIVLDIEGKLPYALRENFDHAFSFYTLHWIKNQETAFRNIYKLLAENGDCLLMFLGHMPIFDVYRRLARKSKWGAWLRDVDRYVSPYHDSQVYFYFSEAVAAINPFNIPKDLFEEFMEDYIEVISNMRM
ncbi:Juvenile hormone acid methyltransferase, partial [Operophtera brumata]